MTERGTRERGLPSQSQVEGRSGRGASAAGPAAPRPQAGPARALGARPRAPLGARTSSPPAAVRLETALGWRIADAYLVLAALALLELCVVSVLGFREMTGPHELGWAVRDLLPLALSAAAPCAILGGALVELLSRGERLRWRLAIAALAAACGGAVAFGVSGGRMLQGGLRAPFVAAVALLAAGASFALGPRIQRALAGAAGEGGGGAGALLRGSRARLLVAVGVAALALEIANARVLPRLYPAFHLGVGALTLAIACLAAVALPASRGEAALDERGGGEDGSAPALGPWPPRLVRAALALVLFAIAAALTPAAAVRLARADNLRIIVLSRGPLLGRVVELGAMIAPPEPLDDPARAPLEELTSGHAIDLRGRDVVLITVDALRADHVGAYGYGRPITPSLDRLASEGVLFEAAYTPTPHTSYAVASLMTGKYMRPLLLQGLGEDSETWAQHLRRYGYRTAAFYPPAVFFIDGERFGALRDRALDFEYRKIEFASAGARVEQVKRYLDRQKPDRRLFLWVHLFEPHEPYEAHPEHAFGDRDIDRYDGEVAAADAGLGAIVAEVRRQRPSAVVIATADHGEEFGEHGGRYHGTTVYEEQVRVPLVISAPGLLEPRRVATPVSLVDLLPTVLAGLDIPRPARVRGADLGPLLIGKAPPDSLSGVAPPEGRVGGAAPSLAAGPAGETESQAMLARGALRLVCARRIGACALYDVAADPGQTRDVSAVKPAELAEMRAALRALEASHGRYEMRGLRQEGKGWPDALRRGIAGDGDAVIEVAALLDDADVVIRRKAGEVLFDLRRPEAAPALRLALVRDEDDEARRWAALALTRLGEGAPLTRELLADPDRRWRRLAALALAESGDKRGEDILIAWLRSARSARPTAVEGAAPPTRPSGGATPENLSFERAREVIEALAKLRSKAAVGPILGALEDVRLRPYAAAALAAIGEDAARPALVEQLERERYHTARVALTEALVKLGAGPELRAPLVWLLGTPDPLPGGLALAQRADILDLIGGPRDRDLDRLRRFARSGVALGVTVPKAGNGKGLRVLCRARATDGEDGEVRVGMRAPGAPPPKREKDSLVPAAAPEIDPARSVSLLIPKGGEPVEAFAALPPTIGVRAGEFGDFVVYATQNVELQACVVVPLSDELPPPPPEPWSPGAPGTPGEGDGEQPGDGESD